eukprot:6426422-Prorocentrum_lima.AAC.1
MSPCDKDQNLEPWFNRWQDIFYSMETMPDANLMRSIQEMFVDQLRNCGAMKTVLMYYDTTPEGHVAKTYEWLSGL